MKIKRRSFFKTGLLLPALRWDSLAAEPAVRTSSSFDPWVEIHSENLGHNIKEIYRHVESRPILAVIKNNGYGSGVTNIARLLEPLAPIAGFAVVKMSEAITLRNAGIRKPILLMGPFDEKELDEVIRRNIIPMVYTSIGPTLEKLSRKYQKSISVHICVDTGIGREGIPYRQAASLIRDLASFKSVRIQGTMTTFTEDYDFDKEQLGRFLSLCKGLEKEGLELGRKHAASSFGLFQHSEAFLDMVRPGMVIYGIFPEDDFRKTGLMDLRPALSLKTRVIYVKQLRRGESAGYNRVFMADDDVWVATIPVGHADGLPRAVTKGARVRVGNELYPIVAISASHCIVAVGREPRVRIGDEVTVFDWREGSRPEDFALACGGSVYDLTMHLNPLLPRRIL